MSTFIDQARNGFGRPLTPDCRARLAAFFDAPSPETWDAVCSVIVNGRSLRCGTVWQAVTAVDPTFPRSARGKTPAERWPVVPDALTVARAVKLAVGA